MVMLTPWEFSPGIFFDTRSVMLSLSGLFFGPLPAGIACLMTTLLRLFQGGAGAPMGIAVIVTATALGLITRGILKNRIASITIIQLILMGIVVHGVMLGCSLLLPPEIRWPLLQDISLPVMTLYPLMTVLIGNLMQTDLKRQLKTLAITERQEQLLKYIEKAPNGIFVADGRGRYVDVNQGACRITGYSREEILQRRIPDILPPEPDIQKAARKHFEQVTRSGVASSELPFLTKDGRRRYWTIDAVQLEEDRFIGFVRDTTAAREAADERERALREKEVLLRELYHRTKNNMQVIRSLIALQRAHTDNPLLDEAYRDTENRIQSMALVHKMLYETKDLSKIDLREYLKELLPLLISTASLDEKPEVIFTPGPPAPVPLDISIPLGLIINELVSNSVKHGFRTPGGEEFHHGKQPRLSFALELSPSERGERLMITYEDNGRGLPEGFDHRQTNSMGFTTIIALGEEQLKGTVTPAVRPGGFHCRLTIPLEDTAHDRL